jgi:hypothetical protein
MATCFICGAKAGFACDRISESPLIKDAVRHGEYPDTLLQFSTEKLCLDCDKGLRRLCGQNTYHDYSYIGGIPKSIEYFEKLVPSIKNQIIKSIVEERIVKSKSLLDKINSYPEFIEKVRNKILQSTMQFKEVEMHEVQNFDRILTLWKKENVFYFTSYGMEFIKGDYFLSDFVLTREDIGKLDAIDHYQKHVLDNGIAINKINIDNILFFQEKGDIQYSTSVSGGGGQGGGVNPSGAVLGGLLFGEAGAIVGSNAGTNIKINAVTSTTKKHDDRYVILRYKADGTDIISEEKFSFEVYNVFMELFPEKEYSYISLNTNSKPKNEKANGDPLDQIRKLKELLDLGALNQEEFDAKKKQLLGI